MNQFFGEICKKTDGRRLYDITSEVKHWVSDKNIINGLLTINIQHTSASLLVNENYDSDVLIDLENFFSRLVLDNDDLYIHTSEGSDDMPAHIRTALTQTNLSFPVENKKITLGQWQGIFLCEHRYNSFNRRVSLHLIGE
jgi:secondary thiamine-phosphate synthase enzyme